MVKEKHHLIDLNLLTNTISELLDCYNDIDSFRHLIKKQFAVSALLETQYTDFMNVEEELSTLIYEIECKYKALIQALTKYFNAKKISEIRKIFTAFSTAIIHLADSLLTHLESESRRTLLVGEREKVQNLSESVVKHLNKIDRIQLPKNTSVNLKLDKAA